MQSEKIVEMLAELFFLLIALILKRIELQIPDWSQMKDF